MRKLSDISFCTKLCLTRYYLNCTVFGLVSVSKYFVVRDVRQLSVKMSDNSQARCQTTIRQDVRHQSDMIIMRLSELQHKFN